eukprot:TRINITY_DN3376_c0_g1_i1.p1 TRINITY_DN3376_c0_g1~~TRINITY_DN3376_c0_g1_i1.p1  ORF type:complete len:578 (+),score=69.77 TRINITY_DN3376_c0_g1_i1:571-2304(+)
MPNAVSSLPFISLVVLVCLSSFFHSSNALIVSSTFTMQSVIVDFIDFGFNKDGTVYLDISSTPPPPALNLTFYLCQEKEYEAVWSTAQQNSVDGGRSKLCGSAGRAWQMCELSAIEFPNATHNILRHSVQSTNQYHLILIQCTSPASTAATPAEVGVYAQLVNPGGEQLSVGYIPLPKVYSVLVVAWIAVIFGWGFYWGKNCAHLVSLHWLLALVMVLKLVVDIVAFIYFRVEQTTGYTIASLKILQSVLFAISETLFFCALLLISKGCRITRPNFPPTEVRNLVASLVLLLCTLLFFSFYNEGYYFLSLMIMYFFMLPKIFTSITRNTRALQTQLLMSRLIRSDADVDPLVRKMKMFKVLRTAVILYLGSILMVSSMRIVMFWYIFWVYYCAAEVVSLIMVFVVVFLLKPNERGVFSSRSFFESPQFPILNMQFENFDEVFGDQGWDPEMVLHSGALNLEPSVSDGISNGSTIVIEYPSRKGSNGAKYSPMPPLVVGILEKNSSVDSNISITQSDTDNTNDNNTNDNNHTTTLSLDIPTETTTTTTTEETTNHQESQPFNTTSTSLPFFPFPSTYR